MVLTSGLVHLLCTNSVTACGLCKMSMSELLCSMATISELVDKGDIPEERQDGVKKGLHKLGYLANRPVGKAFLKITEKQMTDAILAEVESVQGDLL